MPPPEEMIREFERRHNVMVGYYWRELADEMKAEIKRLKAALRSVQNHELRDHEDYEAIKEIADDALRH